MKQESVSAKLNGSFFIREQSWHQSKGALSSFRLEHSDLGETFKRVTQLVYNTDVTMDFKSY